MEGKSDLEIGFKKSKCRFMRNGTVTVSAPGRSAITKIYRLEQDREKISEP
jgi:hypothetical protein